MSWQTTITDAAWIAPEAYGKAGCNRSSQQLRENRHELPP